MSITTSTDRTPLPGPRELVSLAQAMAEVNSRVELEEVLALGVDRAASVLGAEVAVISFRTTTGWIIGSGFPGETAHRDSLPEDTPEAIVRQSGEPLRASIREARWGEPAREWGARHNLGPYLGVPLRSGGTLMGNTLMR